MAQEADRLFEIGLEGFALIDEWYGHQPTRTTAKRLPCPKDQHQQAYDHFQLARFPRQKMEVTVLTSQEAARYYGGFVIMEYRNKK